MARDSPTTDLDFSASPRRAALPRYGHRAGRRRRSEEIILDAGDPVGPGGGRPGARLRQSRGLVGAEPIYSLQADGHVEKAHEYYAHLGHHIVGDNTVCVYTQTPDLQDLQATDGVQTPTLHKHDLSPTTPGRKLEGIATPIRRQQ